MPRGRPPKKLKKVEEEPIAAPASEIEPEFLAESPVEEESHEPQVAESQYVPLKQWSGQEVLSVKPSLQMPGYFDLTLLNGSTTTLPKEECELYNLI